MNASTKNWNIQKKGNWLLILNSHWKAVTYTFLTRASPATQCAPALHGGKTRVGDTSNNAAHTELA